MPFLRRRRATELDPLIVDRIWSSFEQDRANGALSVLEVRDEHLGGALRVLNLAEAPLRTLETLHLAVAQGAHASECVTSDRTMATGGEELGREVRFFADCRGTSSSPR